nr:uncharacterized mitochondrial protein AtMg00810-like [Tanacetum cinerariifolium]
MIPGTLSSRLMPNPPSSTPCVPPTKNDWDTLFQPMFDELSNPPPSVVSLVPTIAAQRPADPTGSHVSTSINQDAPSSIEPTNVKEAMLKSSWIEAMQEEMHDSSDYKFRISTLSRFCDVDQTQKYGMPSSDLVDIPMLEKSKMDEDLQGKPVDPTHYRKMIGSVMYLTYNRPDLVLVVCMCVRYREQPTKKHLLAVKGIFQYLKGTIDTGL